MKAVAHLFMASAIGAMKYTELPLLIDDDDDDVVSLDHTKEVHLVQRRLVSYSDD